ncbi:MAG: hypothetical protein KJZ87_02610 [Thermoguttaceae bacterium]|nr:hypothetical protein [Thermoguttaceae bacterium]
MTRAGTISLTWRSDARFLDTVWRAGAIIAGLLLATSCLLRATAAEPPRMLDAVPVETALRLAVDDNDVVIPETVDEGAVMVAGSGQYTPEPGEIWIESPAPRFPAVLSQAERNPPIKPVATEPKPAPLGTASTASRVAPAQSPVRLRIVAEQQPRMAAGGSSPASASAVSSTAMPSIVSSLTIPPVRKVDSRQREWTLDEPICAPRQMVSSAAPAARQAAPLSTDERPAHAPAVRFTDAAPAVAPAQEPARAEAGPTTIRFRPAASSRAPESITALPDRGSSLR